MPIRTFLQGVLVTGAVVMATLVSVSWSPELASAAPKTTAKRMNAATQKRVVKTSTTRKGVRSTAYSKRRSYAKKAYAAPRSVALPAISDGGDHSVAERARQVLGARYKWGGNGPGGFDCSGLVKHALGGKAAHLPRTSAGMYSAVQKVDSLQVGDLVFFGRGRVHHVGVYAGDGSVIHASGYGRGVRSDSLATLARSLGYAGAGRI